MASRPRLSDTLASLAALFLGDLLSLCSLAASHPLLLAYLLFFLPYLLGAISFLGPLLLSTASLLLALLTVTDGSSTPPAAAPAPFGHTLAWVLEMLSPCARVEEPGASPPEPLSDIASELLACVDAVEAMYRGGVVGGAGAGAGQEGDGGEEEEEKVEEKRIVAEGIPGHESFGWELEAISKLYKALTYEVEEFPIKLALRNLKEGELPPPGTGFHHGGGCKVEVGEAGRDLPRKEAPPPGFESRGCKMPTSDAGGDLSPVSAIKSRHLELPARRASEEDLAEKPTKKAPAPPHKNQGISRSDSDGSRWGKLLRSSPSSREAGGGLARVASFGEWRGSGGSRAPESVSRSSSTRKEKEWKRTLAGKLYEERMIAAGGEEGMDLLWEAYDADPGKDAGRKGSHGSDEGRKGGKAKGAAKGELEEEEEEVMVGRLCCLQALRFSTAKMSFRMGRSNLLKVSSAMKGMGVFRHSLRGSRKGK
uniref:Protease n=1 Tax=Anthurium amnicola TaxID=1678845 RepID=A0A1D1Z567_9ARAE